MMLDPKIDELLNGFIDGELSQRQQTEVQRLLVNDEQIAKRLRRLERCRMFLGALPRAEAPDGLLEDIKASLERRALLGEQPQQLQQLEGMRHLFARKLFAAAAMIALVSVLGVVVYSIVSPQTPEGAVVAIDGPGGRSDIVSPAPAAVAVEFYGTLELKTGAFFETDASVQRIFESNGLSDAVRIDRVTGTSRYALACGRRDLDVLLAGLQNVWSRFDAKTLFVQTDKFGERVVVEGVTTAQIAEIVGRDTSEKCIRTAMDFAVLNKVDDTLPGKAILAAVADGQSDITSIIPKPRLTRYEDPLRRATDTGDDGTKVNLVVVVTAAR